MKIAKTSKAVECVLAVVIFNLIFGVPANAAIKSIDQCREAVDDFAAMLAQQERLEDAKTQIFEAWNACKMEDFATAEAKMNAAKALITGDK